MDLWIKPGTFRRNLFNFFSSARAIFQHKKISPFVTSLPRVQNHPIPLPNMFLTYHFLMNLSTEIIKDPGMDDAITVISLLSLRQSTDRFTSTGSLKINTSLTGGSLNEKFNPLSFKSERFDLLSSSESSISFSEHSNSSMSVASGSSRRYKPSMHPIRVNFKFGTGSINGSPMFKSTATKTDAVTSAPAGRPFMLQIAKHPPAKALYRRTLKPFPTVCVIHGDAGAVVAPNNLVTRVTPAVTNTQNMLVEAVLIREDRYELPAEFLDGVRVVPLSPSGTATFKKLKIMSTSQVCSTAHFRRHIRTTH
jgi:hypothetical protein